MVSDDKFCAHLDRALCLFATNHRMLFRPRCGWCYIPQALALIVISKDQGLVKWVAGKAKEINFFKSIELELINKSFFTSSLSASHSCTSHPQQYELPATQHHLFPPGCEADNISFVLPEDKTRHNFISQISKSIKIEGCGGGWVIKL